MRVDQVKDVSQDRTKWKPVEYYPFWASWF